jgi:peptidoglycan hydrolase-like protein with peptidoglycan-binding domain
MEADTLSIGAFGPNVSALHTTLQRLGYAIGESELRRAFFGPVTRQVLQRFQTEHQLAASGRLDDGTAKAIIAALSAKTTTGGAGSKAAPDPNVSFRPNSPAAAPGAASTAAAASRTTPDPGIFGPSAPVYTLNGYLVFDNGLPAAEISTRLYTIGFGGQDALLGETTTDTAGNYSISYRLPAPGTVNLQVRVLNTGGNEVTLSTTKYNAAQQETLNLVGFLPAKVPNTT